MVVMLAELNVTPLSVDTKIVSETSPVGKVPAFNDILTCVPFIRFGAGTEKTADSFAPWLIVKLAFTTCVTLN